MVLCLASYLNWVLSLLVPTGTFGSLPNLGAIAVLLTSATVFSIGAALALVERPAKLRNLLWIPLIYAYWFLQTVIAGHALLRVVLGRRKVWQKTAKDVF
jgi:hypothetical protein